MASHLHLDPFSGASGDMFLGLLADLGVPAGTFEDLPARLGLDDVVVRCATIQRGGLACGRVEVTVGGRPADAHAPVRDDDHSHGGDLSHGSAHAHAHGRRLGEMLAVVERAALPARAAARADRAIRLLFDAEARVHGRPVEEIHLHEAGGDDALVDIAGTVLGLEALGIATVSCSLPLPAGGGTVHAAHGELPVPAPAVAELLRGLDVRGGPVDRELITPTGAALLRAVVDAFGPAPRLALAATGFGAGTRDDPGRANALRGLLGERTAPAGERELDVLECAVDDMLPQDVPALLDALLDAGARDAFVASVLMKKGRPGLRITAIADPERSAAVVRRMLAHSSSLGVRIDRQRRVELARDVVRVDTPWGPVEVKRAFDVLGGELRRRAEFEACRRAADEAGVPVDTVRRHAERPGGGPDAPPPGDED